MYAAAAEKHKAELAATKRDLQKRVDTAKREGRHLLKQCSGQGGAAHLQHKLDVKTAEVNFILRCSVVLCTK